MFSALLWFSYTCRKWVYKERPRSAKQEKNSSQMREEKTHTHINSHITAHSELE